MTERRKLILLILLLVISVATLLQAFFSEEKQMYYVVATSISHLALIVFGYHYAKGRAESKAAERQKWHGDVFGTDDTL